MIYAALSVYAMATQMFSIIMIVEQNIWRQAPCKLNFLLCLISLVPNNGNLNLITKFK